MRLTSTLPSAVRARASLAARLVALGLLASAPSAQFVNGDFETGDFTGWTLEYGQFPCALPTTWSTTLPAGHPPAAMHTTSSPLQPGQTLAVAPFEGTYMARINDIDGGKHATRISQAVALTSADIALGNVQVQWGAMLVNPAGHGGGCQPLFSIDVLVNGVTVETFSADGSAAATAGSGWVAAGADGGTLWHTTGQFCTDVTPYQAGDLVEVRMTATDCGAGAHGGFAYLDDVRFGACHGTECMEVAEVDTHCGDGGEVFHTFTITNNSGVDASWLLIPDPGGGVTISPNVILLDPVVSGSGGTATVTVTVSGAPPGELCIDMALQDAMFSDCCSTDTLHCFDVPDCSPCGDVLSVNAHCTGIDDDFLLTFTFENTSSFPKHKAFLIPPAGTGITAFDDDFDLVALTGSAVDPTETATLSSIISGATPGDEVCFTVVIHDDDLDDCCSFEVCVTAPMCSPGPLVTVDVGHSGPGDTDLDLTGNPIGTGGQVISHVYEAPASVPAWTVVGFQNLPIPLFGGTLVPSDAAIVLLGFTDAEGELEVSFHTASLPPGFTVYLQAVVLDIAEPGAFGFSNGLEVRKLF